MITEIKIKGFKSLKNATINFYTNKNISDKNKYVTRKHELKTNGFKYTFNLAGIIGANATGKSSFLEAIYIYKQIVMNNFKLNDFNVEKICGLEMQEKEFNFEYLIENNLLIHNLKLDGKFNILSETLSILEKNVNEEKWNIIFDNKKNYSLLWRVAQISEYEKNFTNKIFNFPSNYIKLINKIFTEVETISVFGNNFELSDYNSYLNNWKQLLKINFKNKISKKNKEKLNLLKSLVIAVDSSIIDFGYDKEKDDIFLIVSDFNKQIKVPFQSFSDGTKRFISMMLPIFLKKDRSNFYLIDEIENSFHPRLIDTILRLFYFNENNVNNSQLLFTTHNPYIFDLTKIHNSCINISLYSFVENFQKLSNFDNYKRNDKLFSKNYMAELINSHPDSNNIYDIYEKFSSLENDYERL